MVSVCDAATHEEKEAWEGREFRERYYQVREVYSHYRTTGKVVFPDGELNPFLYRIPRAKIGEAYVPLSFTFHGLQVWAHECLVIVQCYACVQ